ncbi:hypothetical protein CS0771_61220 [Catellatospora sp. IY07-71]|uniref:putative bifunctional diguanylate cyclase/phosphodiesterase n=1 Tax=Catellatospora sp. IY07-71 TaxID=2728827 RepID=UPI001BB32476|nr:EAL domain-containing protein [Catellatospora sp. IY07-71]BCJ76578.1 hypothetical protein CS0771_61220 [Catellatospora sp. IY07-71]
MPHASPLDTLARELAVVDAKAGCDRIAAILRPDPQATSVAVADGDRLGLVMRHRFDAAAAAGQAGPGVPAAAIAYWHPLRLPGRTTAVAASEEMHARPREHRYDDVLVDLEGGGLGVIPAVRLFDVVATQFAERAHYDDLTGLINRAKFLDLLMAACAATEQDGDEVAVAFIDLDGMKRINDRLGHRQGDAALAQVGRRLREATRPGEVAARLGGDEFAVLSRFPRDGDPAAVAEDLGRRCLLAITARDGHAGAVPRMRASIGVAVTARCADPQALVDTADALMYRAKQAGGNRVELEADTCAASARPSAAAGRDRLEAALEQGELRLHYQPIVRLSDHRVQSIEALIRWQHPEHGLLGPGRFLPAVHQAGLMPLLDTWVLRRACTDLAELISSLGHAAAPDQVNVNLSTSTLATAFDDTVLAVLRETGLAAHRLRIELPEDAELEALSAARARLERLTRHGVLLTLDDMGAGSTNLRYLSSLTVQGMKIDQGFVDGMLHNSRDHAVVKLLTDLGHGLGMRVTAEGVENGAQLAALTELGVPFAQGYHLGMPLPLPELRQRLARAGAASGPAVA